ncbi:MFS transporter [bacterium]|nr:MAG: MFS transporter [bacterium]
MKSSFLPIGLAVFLTTLGMATNVGNLPINLLLKERMGLSATAVAVFWAVTYSPWHLRPFAALAVDALPFLGARRRGYVVVASFVGAAAWLVIAFRDDYHGLAFGVGLINLCLVVSAAAMGGLLVAAAKRTGDTGRIGSVRTMALSCADLVGGPLGGALAGRPIGLAAAFGAAALGGAGLLAARLPEPSPEEGTLEGLAHRMRRLVRSRGAWIAVGMVTLVMASPGFGTPLLYYQRDVLHFSPALMGWLGTLNSFGGLAGGAAYVALSRRLSFRALLSGGVLAHALGTMAFVLYRGPASAGCVTFLSGLLGAITVASLIDLAARATPDGLGSLGLALVLTALELSYTLSNLLGSVLYDRLHLTFLGLLGVSVAFSLVAIFAVPFVPRELCHRTEPT